MHARSEARAASSSRRANSTLAMSINNRRGLPPIILHIALHHNIYCYDDFSLDLLNPAGLDLTRRLQSRENVNAYARGFLFPAITRTIYVV